MPSLQKIVITEIDRSRLQAVIDRARQFGDESRERLDDLERELMRAEIVDAGAMPEGVVVMNATVTVRDLDCNETETYTLVYPKDADISRNRISVLAPVGTAIIGSRVGEVVSWSVPRGSVKLRIESVVAPAARVEAEEPPVPVPM